MVLYSTIQTKPVIEKKRGGGGRGRGGQSRAEPLSHLFWCSFNCMIEGGREGWRDGWMDE